MQQKQINQQPSNPLKPIALLGAGSWGSALALYLARRGQAVRLWSIDSSEIAAIISDQANNRYLPGHSFPACIEPHTDLGNAIKGCEDVLMVVPSVGYRQTLALLKPLIQPHTRIACATKGLDAHTGELLSEVTHQVLGEHHPFAVISGPSFAKEVAKGLPTAVVIASKDPMFREALTQRFDSPIFKVDQSDDVIGVEIGCVIKNVVAIATGIADGMALGTNTRSALITRGLAEMISLGITLGGKQDTFIGLSGLGDLILTCSDDQSRNRRLGLKIGAGMDIEHAEQEIGQIVEGKRNAELVDMLARQHHINMPICTTIWSILKHKKVVTQDIILNLLSHC